MSLRGRAHKYGDEVNTDVIIPARYLTTTDPKELAAHCMEDLDKDFVTKVKPGDVMVAGKNFGCGSSREHAPRSIRAAGISCIIAEGFARIFYRNSINLALPVLESPEAAKSIQDGDDVEVDLEAGTIINQTRHQTFTAKPYPPFMKELMKAGGLMAYVKSRMGQTPRGDEDASASAAAAKRFPDLASRESRDD